MEIKKRYNKYKKVIENIASLSILNALNYLFPLILIPYLISVLGLDTFGKYSFALAVLQYMSLSVNYGFQFSGTNQIAINRDDNEVISEIFSNIISTRLLISIIAIITLLILIYTIPILSSISLLLIFGIGIIIGNALVPTWFFQGLEEMKYLTVINLIPKLISTIAIMMFVKSEFDYTLITMFMSIGQLVAGLFSISLAFLSFKLVWKKPSYDKIFFQLKDSWFIFLSTIGMNLYRETNTILLGFLTDFSLVGIYSAAEKLIKIIQSLVNPITQALFPFFGRKLKEKSDMKPSLEKLNLFGKYYSFFLFSISILVLFIVPKLIYIFLGDKFIKAIPVFNIMTFVILFGGLNYFYGIIGLINMGYKKKFSKFVIYVGFLNIFYCTILILFFNEYGASISLLISEILLFTLIFSYYKKITISY